MLGSSGHQLPVVVPHRPATEDSSGNVNHRRTGSDNVRFGPQSPLESLEHLADRPLQEICQLALSFLKIGRDVLVVWHRVDLQTDVGRKRPHLRAEAQARQDSGARIAALLIQLAFILLDLFACSGQH